MKRTLEQHEHMIDDHQDKLDGIQQDVVDIKVRLGLKDITNGNVVKYQEELVKAQEREREERKEQDKLLLEQISKIDGRLWYLVVGVGVTVLLELGALFIQSQL